MTGLLALTLGATLASAAEPAADFVTPLAALDDAATATVRFWEDGEALRYTVDIAGDAPVRAFLRAADPGTTGPVVAILDAPTGDAPFAGVLFADDLRGPLADDPVSDLVAAMAAGDVQVRLHTEAWTAGQLRGQVEQASASASR